MEGNRIGGFKGLKLAKSGSKPSPQNRKHQLHQMEYSPEHI